MKKIIRGEQLFVFAGEDYAPLGASTDCALHVECSTIEVCSTVSRQRRYRRGKISWSIDCSGFYMLSAVPVRVEQPIAIAMSVLGVGRVLGGVDLETLAPNGMATLKGEAIITGLEVAGSKGGFTTYRASFQGSGEVAVEVKDVKGFPYVFPLIFA